MSGFKDTLARNVTDNDAYTHRVFGELKVKEKDFQAQLIKVVDMLGGLVYHTYDSRRSARGYPDLTIVLKDGAARRVLWAELKVGKKQPTDSQWIWLRGLPDHQAYLWRPDDFDVAVHIIATGHRVAPGIIQAGDGTFIQPLPITHREPTCITCSRQTLDIL